MKNDKITILYVDDILDNNLSRFLKTRCKDEGLLYFEYCFSIDVDMDKFFYSDEVKDADIIIIDNLLYENSTAKRKDTGGSIVPLLQYGYPFKKLLMITKDGNPIDEDMIYVKKFDDTSIRNRNESMLELSYKYYKEELWDKWIALFIREIKSELAQLKQFESAPTTGAINELTKERIRNTAMGESSYRTLSSEDVLSLIEKIQNLIEKVGKK